MRSLSFRSGCFLLALGLALSASACGGGHDDLTKRLASVQTELGKLQKHNERLEERLQALEMKKEAPQPRVAGSDSPGTVERPRLMVVKLEPGDSARGEAAPDAPTAAMPAEDSAADTSPRPMIRLYGSGDTGSSRKRSGN
jgi:hypothetical protein